jgi:hypothetical protein
VRNPKLATHQTAQVKPPTVLSDEQMRQNYLAKPLDERQGTEIHVRGTYEEAQLRRAFRQAHVIQNWGERDRKILFLLILGWMPKTIGAQFGISRQAVEKRLHAMLEETGMEEYTQLVLWFLGFIALLPDTSKTTPGTTLIKSCEYDPAFRQLARPTRQ